MNKQKHYPELPAVPDLPSIEAQILEFWGKEQIFQASVDNRRPEAQGGREFVFYDGPPFANGLPHYGHLVTGYVKDIVPRYQTMRGYRVDRRFGWDCHGLPAELEAEKELGISGREKIIHYGVKSFNDFCRTSVLRYTSEWETIVTRQGRWVDFAHDYKTMDTSYMESVIWAFKQLYEKGLIYQGLRVLPYSWAAETPVSNFETRLDNSYRERIDPAITVLFTLTEPDEGRPLKMLVWTTTPWTLPSNLALAVGAGIDYDIVEEDGIRYVIAGELREKYARELKRAEHIRTVKGAAFVGRTYRPMFPFFADIKGAFRVLNADFVSTEDGTGIVHIAPGFGEDDFNVCQEAGIPVVCPVDNRGRFTAEVPPFAGQNVIAANKPVTQAIKEMGALVRQEQYAHSYPHCWRTDEPLIYKAVSSWFLKVTAFRDRMVELNRQINWIPEYIKDSVFGSWLENAKDWSISRQRFWGSPIPVWVSDDRRYPRVDVYGSLDEIERDFGVRPSDLHRPGIDELVRANPDDPSGHSQMRRVEEVFDCWFESGSMPYAQVHYPFENRQWLEKHFPADFIVEYIAQTRGWFYTLMVLSTALFDRPPFLNCVCHGVVLDENGQKLSKRLRNYPSPEEVFATQGSDALRWFLVSSPILRGGNLMIDRQGSEIAMAARKAEIPLWNASHFFCLYANAEGVKAAFDFSSADTLDRYLLSKTRVLVEELAERMDAFDIVGACALAPPFFDAMNNWYIRRNRGRFWSKVSSGEERAAYDTLYTVLVTVLKALAPLLPFTCEHLFRGLTGERSVHLADWPDVAGFPKDTELIEDIDLVREACSAAKSVRETNRLRTRLPLQKLVLAGAGTRRLSPYAGHIQEEVNVKQVELVDDFSPYAERTLFVNSAVAGKRLRGALREVQAAARCGQWSVNPGGTVSAGGQELEPGEYEVRLVIKEGISAQALPGNRAVAVLDTRLTPELEREGMARDFIRFVQQVRKDTGLDVSDRIRVKFNTESAVVSQAIEEHSRLVAEQVLALEINKVAALDGAPSAQIEGAAVKIAVAKAH